MEKYSQFKLTHSHFFSLYKSEDILNDIPTKSELGKSFKHNLGSVISILRLPITLSVSRTKLHLFDKFHGSELILNAPMPKDLYDSVGEFKSAQTEGRKKALDNAKKQFFEELESKEGAERFWNITFQFLEDCLKQNQELQLASKEVLKQSTVLLWTSFEVLTRDLVIEVLNHHSDKFKDLNVKSIPTDILEKYDYNINDHLGEIYAGQRDWSNLKKIQESIKQIWPEKDDLHNELKGEILYKINQRRHLIVHKKGLVDEQYNSSTSDNYEIGTEIPIKPIDLKDGLEVIKKIGQKLLGIFDSEM